MKRKIFIVRHAKSDWGDATLSDVQRPLNDRGLRDAPVMAKRWKEAMKSCDLVLSSPAVRARLTAEIFMHELRLKAATMLIKKEIYDATAIDLLQVINGISDEYFRVVLFGHNPGLSDLVAYLTGQDIQLPTCAVVALETSLSSWTLVSANTCSLQDFDYPKRSH